MAIKDKRLMLYQHQLFGRSELQEQAYVSKQMNCSRPEGNTLCNETNCCICHTFSDLLLYIDRHTGVSGCWKTGAVTAAVK